ncbi:MAG: hypothetical protein LBU41_02885 [Clostridiales Family XIII bacterium]|jgi:hypothetical protein|nr:hypothetical protein [Clostridiales Family XIII bacterium]
MQAVILALEVYFLGFVIATIMAAIIKLIVIVTSKKKAAAPAVAKEGEVS